jgi:hypothetical protein
MEMKMARRLGILALAFAIPLLMAIPAEASPIVLSFESGSTALQSLFGDNFSLSEIGTGGFLTVNSGTVTTVTLNKATLDIADYTNYNGGYATRLLDLSFALTLDGITHTLTQNAQWSITPTFDSVVSAAASTPVEFDTASGAWSVSLNGFSVGGGALGTFSAPVTAKVRGVPEPATILLFATALVAGGIQLRRKRPTDR